MNEVRGEEGENKSHNGGEHKVRKRKELKTGGVREKDREEEEERGEEEEKATPCSWFNLFFSHVYVEDEGAQECRQPDRPSMTPSLGTPAVE
ncbi:hypothetical protein Pcinc_040969 [Petrolisthes cinctipes]|uniref:Uncharacterized protein n=1 Tax=Petrolisthes cinctipes TaxID=88211 RepID=A0AAE1BN75_PETCI|nr:hypothetical protein Pcinc_040969 [Petrolisthes cinctipes]